MADQQTIDEIRARVKQGEKWIRIGAIDLSTAKWVEDCITLLTALDEVRRELAIANEFLDDWNKLFPDQVPCEIAEVQDRMIRGLKIIVHNFDTLNGVECERGCGECIRCIANAALAADETKEDR